MREGVEETCLQVLLGLLEELVGRVCPKERVPFNDNVKNPFVIGKGLDVETVRRSVGRFDGEGDLCDVRLDAPLESSLGIDFHFMIRAVTDLRDVMTRCNELEKEAVVGAVATR